jgi:hypothetical protein
MELWRHKAPKFCKKKVKYKRGKAWFRRTKHTLPFILSGKALIKAAKLKAKRLAKSHALRNAKKKFLWDNRHKWLESFQLVEAKMKRIALANKVQGDKS